MKTTSTAALLAALSPIPMGRLADSGICGCGCGSSTRRGSRFLQGHDARLAANDGNPKRSLIRPLSDLMPSK